MGRLNLVERRAERFLRESPSLRNAAGVIVVVTVVVVLADGPGISPLDGGGPMTAVLRETPR